MDKPVLINASQSKDVELHFGRSNLINSSKHFVSLNFPHQMLIERVIRIRQFDFEILLLSDKDIEMDGASIAYIQLPNIYSSIKVCEIKIITNLDREGKLFLEGIKDYFEETFSGMYSSLIIKVNPIKDCNFINECLTPIGFIKRVHLVNEGGRGFDAEVYELQLQS